MSKKIPNAEKNMSGKISDIKEKIDSSRYKIGILQELFAVPPDCEGYHKPTDLALFYIGIKTLLDEIMNGNTEATDDLFDLFTAVELNRQ
jgi:hypothetical protein